MPYRYRGDIATADAAFEAWGESREAMFIAAADATMNVMVGDLATIADRERRTIEVRDEALDLLLFQFLGELVFYKDAERLLLRARSVTIEEAPGGFTARAEAYGETIDRHKHELIVDVKAVTLHRFEVEQTAEGWIARVILDL